MALDKDEMLIGFLKRLEHKVDGVQKDVSDFRLMLGKISHLENTEAEHYKLIHKRLDREVAAINKDIEEAITNRLVVTNQIANKLDKLDTLIFIISKPKLGILILAGLYMLTFQEFRALIIKLIGVVL